MLPLSPNINRSTLFSVHRSWIVYVAPQSSADIKDLCELTTTILFSKLTFRLFNLFKNIYLI